MEGTRTIQTAFRFREELVSRLKRRARLEHKSVNAYVEEAVEKALNGGEDQYARLASKLKDIKVPRETSPEIEALSAFRVDFTAEELAADDRLAYILGK
jgi:predicted DNA-binding protein